MKKLIFLAIISCCILPACLINKNTNSKTTKIYETRLDSINMFDSLRNRAIPVALYVPKTDKKIKKQKLVIVSHGYFANKQGANKEYSYLTEFLAFKGYFVASIQHELPTDDLIPFQGIPQVVRRPFWDRGVKNILFVMSELKKKYPDLDYKHLILIGHSNGGDMSMLFGQEHPTLVDKIISLDNRRVAFPRTKHPKIYSLRSNDQLADDGVLPTPEEQKKYSTKIIQLKNTTHNNMDNSGNEEQKKEINNYILSFLNDR
ncbi:MAG: alpha/beta hydrolase [Bacteroidetes bacterium]|nr:alpha/beta hydrolase [Bacteroidota bacterium]